MISPIRILVSTESSQRPNGPRGGGRLPDRHCGGVQVKAIHFMLMNTATHEASHELQKLVDAGVRFSLALEHNGWFAVRIGNYLSSPFAASYSPTFELAVASLLKRIPFEWSIAS
jgi:predicted TIM-barrel enzyme